MDPYGLLAILGFLIFLFYIIYGFLNATGNAGKDFPEDFYAQVDSFKEAVCSNPDFKPFAFLCK